MFIQNKYTLIVYELKKNIDSNKKYNTVRWTNNEKCSKINFLSNIYK